MTLPFLSVWLKEKDAKAVSEAQWLNARCLELLHLRSLGERSPKAAALKSLKYFSGHWAKGCHLRVIHKKPSKLFDVSAFLLIQIINEKIDFWTKFLLSRREIFSLKVSCSVFRYFCTICHVPKKGIVKEDWDGIFKPVFNKIHSMKFLNVSMALCNPTKSWEGQANDLCVSANTFFVPRCCLP